ncbi:hypothetical protein G7046_g7724 [Stylonectria norvegica]|nr:hypothetical protein G7046_g7724 [Stylonectria norvegica]
MSTALQFLPRLHLSSVRPPSPKARYVGPRLGRIQERRGGRQLRLWTEVPRWRIRIPLLSADGVELVVGAVMMPSSLVSSSLDGRREPRFPLVAQFGMHSRPGCWVVDQWQPSCFVFCLRRRGWELQPVECVCVECVVCLCLTPAPTATTVVGKRQAETYYP